MPILYPTRAQDLGNQALETFRSMPPGKRRSAFVANHRGTLASLLKAVEPQNANTVDAALCTGFLQDAVIAVMTNRLAPLAAFTRKFTVDPLKPRATVYVKKSSSAGSVQSNPTNFETGDSTLDDIAVTVNEVSKSWHITDAEFNSGHDLQNLALTNARVFANGISDAVTALMVAGSYGTATAIGAASAFDAADLPAILALAKNYPAANLLLDGGHLAYLLPTDKQDFSLGEAGAYGFDLIARQNRWTGATTNACGFICAPDALAVAAGMPRSLPAGEFLSVQETSIEGIDLTVRAATWFSRASRTYWASYDAMFGAAVGDGTQAEVLVTS